MSHFAAQIIDVMDALRPWMEPCNNKMHKEDRVEEEVAKSVHDKGEKALLQISFVA